jgi:O-antigen ligase
MTRALDLLLAAIILYVPYVQHFPVVFDLKGLNLINVMFLVAAAMVMLRKSSTPTPAPLKWQFGFFFALLVWAFAVSQLIDGSRMAEDITTLKTYVFFPMLYFLFYYAVRDLKSIRFLFAAILFVTFVVSVHAIRQGFDYGFDNFSDTHRASGPFAPDYRGANLAAAFFVIFVPLFGAVFLHLRSQITVRLVALFCSAVGIFGVFLTYSRQAYFILAAMFFLHALRRNVLVALLVAAAVLSYESWAPESAIERIQMTEQVSDSGEQVLDKSTESRFVLWEGAGEMIAERPWGVGLGRFRFEIGRFAPEYANYDAHNGYVLLTAETGVFGPVILLFLLFGLLRLGIRVLSLPKTEESKFLGAAYIVSLIGVVLANVFGSRFFNGEVMGNFWVLSALVARYYSLVTEQRLEGAGISADAVSKTNQTQYASVSLKA